MRVRELLAEREQQAVEVKRLQDEKAELYSRAESAEAEVAKLRRLLHVGVTVGAGDELKRHRGPIRDGEYAECDACATKPGMPNLCAVRLHNRSLVDELKSALQHQRNRSTALELERKNTPTTGVADRIVTSPEFRDFVCEVEMHTYAAASGLLALLDREVKR